jgi:rhamnosyltransferase
VPAASVIVRARDEEASIGRTLDLLRRQTIVPEIIVVDSGSTDRTLLIAESRCDRILQIAPERFSYGRALNLGAAAATAPIHFALSAHCFPASDMWIERALSLYQLPEVAAAAGALTLPDGRPLTGTVLQHAADARAHPRWGFSNHASSWRAAIWDEFRFDEQLGGTEDKEWAWRVLHAGHAIAYDPGLWVDMSHQWRTSARDAYRRQKREIRGLATFAQLPPYGVRDLLQEWWYDIPADRHRPAWMHRFLNIRRLAGLAGRYQGMRG